MTGGEHARVRVCTGPAEAARLGAERFAEAAREAVRARGRFAAALSGGSTPRALYALLAEEPFRSAVPWEGVHLFWGDERCVPPGHPRSNYRMAREALLSRVPLPAENVHRVAGELPPREAAVAYEQELHAFSGDGPPRLDLLHLGVGEDAHTASLFPFSPALHERARWVVPTLHPSGEWRVTLTRPVLAAAARVEVLLTGGGKARVARTVICGALDPLRLPAQFVRSLPGEVLWILDRAAAGGLDAAPGAGERE